MSVNGLVSNGPPVLPKWLFFLRIAIIVLCLAVLIAAAINVATFNGWGYYASTSGPGGFLIFDVIFTWIVIGSMLVLEWRFPQFYFRLAYLVLLSVCAIFWLSSWSWAASVAGAFRGAYYDGFGRDKTLDRYGASIAACAALGAFTWVAICVLLAFYVLACLRSDRNTTGAHQTEMGTVPKPEHTATDYSNGNGEIPVHSSPEHNVPQQSYVDPQQQHQPGTNAAQESSPYNQQPQGVPQQQVPPQH